MIGNMKKFTSILAMAGLLFTACSVGDYGIKPADPQGWPEEDPIDFPASITVAAAGDIDYATVETESVAVATVQEFEMPEGAEGKYTLLLDGKTKLALDETLSANAEELKNYVAGEYGKAPVMRALKAQLLLDIMIEGQAALVESNEYTLNVTLTAPFIDSSYYLVGDMAGWDAASAIKFNHSESGVYDDPVFTLVFTTPKENCCWKIIPETNYSGENFWAEGPQGVVGVATDGDPALSGKLVTSAPQAGKIETAGKYMMTINMMDYTFEIKALTSYFMVGALNGWNGEAAKGKTVPFFNTDTDGVYSVTTKFTGDHNYKIWSDDNFGNWDVCYGSAKDGDNSSEGTLVNTGAGAIVTPTGDEYYTVTLDFNTKTYKQEKCENQAPASYEKVGLIGNFNGWADDLELSQQAEHVWYVFGVEFAEDTTLKFRANGGWDTNWGVDGVMGGSDIPVEAGKYDIYLNDITGQYLFIKR